MNGFRIGSNVKTVVEESPALLTDGEIEAVAGGCTGDPDHPDGPGQGQKPQ